MIVSWLAEIGCVGGWNLMFLFEAIPHRSAYSASKHALNGFFDSLKAEVYDSNIHVTIVTPG